MRHRAGRRPPSVRRFPWIGVSTAGVLALLAAGFTGSAAIAQAPAPSTGAKVTEAAATKAEDFLVVDCLLPGQIRRIGAKMTFLGPRRPIKTTTRDCEIRGGEYVSYDRANYATALKVWMESAKQGDAKAQTYVGEIYEKGLGTAPDYAVAAEWYRKAADQNFAAAAINLGSLYERGLGVPRDQREALNWYRKASGLSELTYEIADPPDASRLVQLETEVEQYRKELETRRGELSTAQREIDGLRTSLSQQEGDVQASRAEVADLRRELQAMEAKDRTQTAAQEALRKNLQERESRLQAKEKEAAAQKERLSKLQAPESTVKPAAAETAVQETRTKLTRTESEARAQRAGLEPLKWERDPSGPEIELINVQLVDPPVVQASASDASAGKAGTHTLLVVGRVASPSAIKSFTINGVEQLADTTPNDTRFRAELTVRDAREDRVRLVALDTGKRRTSVELGVPARVQLIASRDKAGGAGTPVSVTGNYHALVIGVSEYSRMSRLETPVRDAEAVSRALRQDYGFNVRLVTNASRTQIMSELNDLREKLGPKDNLLIYFAGRGELDQKNQRAHWLPADARPGEPGSWISDTQLSDVLNVMSARQLLVVSDSPYAARLSRSASGRLEPASKDDDVARAIQSLSAKRARMVMTSGGLQPVTEAAGAQPSVFAGSFLEVLRANRGTMLGRDVYREIQVRLYAAARRLGFSQTPEYAPIKYAGHDGGDFVFVKKKS
jgi:uncharacterized caspase-like protein